jgi:Kdo2-lipid IVA lauroyltransferase/acyltransferase
VFTCFIPWLVQFLRRRGLETLRRWGRCLGLIAFYLARTGRRTALANLERVYGNTLSRSERIRIAKASFINLTLTILESCYAPRFTKPMSEHIDVIGADLLFSAHKEGKGVLFLVPHMGNWEVSSRYMTEHLPVVNAVVRQQKPQWVAKILQEIRAHNGIREIDNRNALRPSLAALRRGETVIMMIDQHISRGAVEVEFFGLPAMTSAAPALLAMRTGCTVLFGACFRRENGKFGGEMRGPANTLVTGDRDQDLKVNTQNYVRVLEGFVREHPEEWMWMHRRWRVPTQVKPQVAE